MVSDSAHPGMWPYAGYVRQIHSSREDAGWRSLLVQRFAYAPVVADLRLPRTADIQLVLSEAGRATMRVGEGDRQGNFDWAPGRLAMLHPGHESVASYRADGPLRSVQVHLPRRALERAAEDLGQPVDYERMTASVVAGDPLLAEVVRGVDAAAQGGVGDLYAESAAAFLTTHLLTHHAGQPEGPAPVREDTRVRTAIALMRDRLAEPLTLADIADQVYLSVFHLVRVFREATGETPHRYLTRLRVEKARQLLRDTDLPIAEIAPRCGFASPGALSTAFLRHTGMRPSTYRNS